MKRPNDCCKSYTIHARNGALVIAETPDRLTIEIIVDTAIGHDGVHLTRAQFQMLCGMNSSYDGLEVFEAPEPEAEPEEEDEDVTVA